MGNYVTDTPGELRDGRQTLRLIGTEPDSDLLRQEVQRWYSAPDASHWMGDGFDARELVDRISDPGTSTAEYNQRNHRCATLGWVRCDSENRPVAFMGGDLMVRRSLITLDDQSVRWEEDGPRTLGFTYVVAPGSRGKGHGRDLVRAVLEHPALAEVDLLACSIDRKNEASLRLIQGIPKFRKSGSDDKSLFFEYDRSSNLPRTYSKNGRVGLKTTKTEACSLPRSSPVGRSSSCRRRPIRSSPVCRIAGNNHRPDPAMCTRTL
ncbi:GNAT family N-acetyltransferase [Rhodococcus opacus]|uniref:GNAT family N-acetyltransferase n=1 Tax=Rhodococcus opacus TaxID=37919 RepID=UPI00374E620F